VEDFCGSAPTTDWRRPAIDLATKVNRFGLTGTTHEPDSIVSIFPRIPVGAICKLPAGEPENACFGVEVNTTDPEKHRAVCACDRDQPNPCDCTAPEAGRRYFVCDSGTSAGRPCTRDEHCRPADCTPTDSRPECKPRCDGTPTCQDSGEVWSHPVPNIKTVCKPNATDPNNNCCWTDADCDGRGNKKQCGHALFDLTEARTSGHVITLDWAVKVGGPKRRGVCGDGTPCDNDAPGPSCPDCRGYSPGIE